MNKLNALERAIAKAEDSAEDARWMQAKEVCRRLDAGETEREIAASWTNLRTGKPYDRAHVHRFASAWREFAEVPQQDRPPWTIAYDGRSSTRTDRAEAKAPETVAIARKLVKNIVEKAPPEVRRTITKELAQADAREQDEVRERRVHEHGKDWHDYTSEALQALAEGRRHNKRAYDAVERAERTGQLDDERRDLIVASAQMSKTAAEYVADRAIIGSSSIRSNAERDQQLAEMVRLVALLNPEGE